MDAFLAVVMFIVGLGAGVAATLLFVRAYGRHNTCHLPLNTFTQIHHARFRRRLERSLYR